MTDKFKDGLVKIVTPPPFCFRYSNEITSSELNVLTSFTELNLHLIIIIFLLNN